MTLEKIIKYLGEYASFCSGIPGYSEVVEDLQEKETFVIRKNPYIGDETVTYLSPREDCVEKKEGQIKIIASTLYGSHNLPDIMSKARIKRIKRFDYADTFPLGVLIELPGELETEFFIKKFNEERWVGLELENILGPFKFSYSSSGDGIYEEGIFGVEAAVLRENFFKDEILLEELLRLDFRSGVMLIGDLHDHNFLIEQSVGNYRARVIDFDRMFSSLANLNSMGGLLFNDDEIEKAVSVLGKCRAESIIALEKSRIRKRYILNRKRIKNLLGIISSSKKLNRHLEGCIGLVDYFMKKCPKRDLKKLKRAIRAENLGVFIGRYLDCRLEVH